MQLKKVEIALAEMAADLAITAEHNYTHGRTDQSEMLALAANNAISALTALRLALKAGAEDRT